MFKLAVLSTLVIASSNAQSFPCNPATQCNGKSILCKSSEKINAMLLGKPDPKNDASSGVCTDAFKWICNAAGYNCKRTDYNLQEAFGRCRIITYPGAKKDQSRWPAENFIQACREGDFTCNDGFCTTSAAGCAKRQGVRYGPQRCKEDDCRADGVLKDVCKMETFPVSGGQECVPEEPALVPTCCPEPDSLEECRFMELEAGAEFGLRQCGGECPDSCATKSPGSDVSTKSPASAPADAPSTAPPTETAITELPPAGVVVNFQQQIQTKDCCCKLSCDCFGDPHCTSFFAQQQTTKISTGSFMMFSNVDVGVELFLGPPQGIIEHVHVTRAGFPRKFMLTSKQCSNRTHNWQYADTLEFVKELELPTNWDVSHSLDPNAVKSFTTPSIYRVRDGGAKILIELTCQPFLWETSPTSKTYRKYTRLDAVVTAWRDKIERDLGDGKKEICCPTQSDNEAWILETGASGYCADPAQFPLPGGNSNPGRRALASVPASSLPKDLPRVAAFSADKERRLFDEFEGMDLDEKVSRHLESANDLCLRYLKLAGEKISALDTMEKCLQNIADFGFGSIEAIITLMEQSSTPKECISSPTDPRLPSSLRVCEAGIVVQYQLEGTSEWNDLRALPAGYAYCNNSLTFDFDSMRPQPGVVLSQKDKFRLKQCTPPVDSCGICTPLQGITDAGFSFVYQCKAYNAYKDFLKYGLLKGLKSGEFACGYKYLGNEDPLACLKEYLPTFFSAR